MPLGMSVPEEYFHVKTGYKSGAKVTVGAELSLTVIGTLQLEGKPVALASGEIVPAGAERGPVFFTGRRGQFVAEGIQPGRYELRFYEGELAPVPFSVPKGASGVLRLGNLKVRKAR